MTRVSGLQEYAGRSMLGLVVAGILAAPGLAQDPQGGEGMAVEKVGQETRACAGAGETGGGQAEACQAPAASEAPAAIEAPAASQRAAASQAPPGAPKAVGKDSVLPITAEVELPNNI